MPTSYPICLWKPAALFDSHSIFPQPVNACPSLNPSRVPQNRIHTLHKLLKALLGFEQLLAPERGEPVILGLAIGLSQLPLRADPATLLHAVQRGIKRPL